MSLFYFPSILDVYLLRVLGLYTYLFDLNSSFTTSSVTFILIFYLIPKVFGTLPFVNGLGLSILAVCTVGEPTVMIWP